MRTTLTLDDDVAISLMRMRKERDLGLKEIVNDALRRGLAKMEAPQRPREPFRVRTFDMGKPLFNSPEELKELMNELQLEEDMRKLGTK